MENEESGKEKGRATGSPAVSSPAHSPGFFRSSLLLLVFNNLAAALGFIFQGMMRRGLSGEDYGLMFALFSFSGFLAIPVFVYTSILSRQWAELGNVSRFGEINRLWWALVVAAAALCVLAALVALPGVPLMMWCLKTSNWKAVVVTILGTGAGVILGLAAPLATARQWFGLIAVGGLLGGLFRIAAGWAGIRLQMPLSGAIAATCLYGGILMFFVLPRVAWPGWRQLPFHRLIHPGREWIAPALLALSGWCLLGADTLVVRRVCTESESGLFSEIMTLGRIMFFVIGPMAVIVLPKTATSLQTDPAARETKIVRRAMGLGAVVLLLAAAVLHLLAPLAFQLLRGSAAPEGVRLLRVAIWCLIPLSLCQLVIPALFARRQEKYLFEFTLLSLLLPAGLWVFRGGILRALLVEGAVGCLLLAFIGWRLRHTLRPENASGMTPRAPPPA